MSDVPAIPVLEVSLKAVHPGLRLDVQFSTSAPWSVLFGPSGSGKSTILRGIAGLLGDGSSVVLNGAALSGTPAEGGRPTPTPPHRRGVTFVSQSPALFPHLTVRQNVAYGAPLSTATTISAVLARFGVEALAGRRSATLSGGEQARVALARAVAREGTRLLLLDEVFTGLDLRARDELIGIMLAWQRETGVPVLSVTHDVGEVMLLGAEVLRLQDGRIAAQGAAREVLAFERQRQIDLLA